VRVPPCRSTKGLPSPASSMCMSKPLVATERSRIRIIVLPFAKFPVGVTAAELAMRMETPRAAR
jgi:hypothetical protein